ncbi:MAG: hypothetical protein EOP56_03305 [Sphingobacteriales bacterium]|nr:MAG: hypothetical protein EOP56_03305 [Sphingobacteriales bacterium]
MTTASKYLSVILITLLFASCNASGDGDSIHADTTSTGYVDTMNLYNQQIEDGATQNQQHHAEGILAGRIEPGDDDMTFKCMDSTMSPNPNTRKFYFKVLGVIISKADGALSEAVSNYLLTIFRTYPADFLSFYRDSHTPKDVIESFLADEFESMEPAAVDTYFASVLSICTTCNADDKKLVEAIKMKVAQEARHNAATDRPQE